MLTGRMSVTEVIPELIPEEPPVSYYNLSWVRVMDPIIEIENV